MSFFSHRRPPRVLGARSAQRRPASHRDLAGLWRYVCYCRSIIRASERPMGRREGNLGAQQIYYRTDEGHKTLRGTLDLKSHDRLEQ